MYVLTSLVSSTDPRRQALLERGRPLKFPLNCKSSQSSINKLRGGTRNNPHFRGNPRGRTLCLRVKEAVPSEHSLKVKKSDKFG